MNESHFDHTNEVLGGLFKTCQHPAAFFQPTNQSFNDVTLAIRFAVELYGSGVTVFIVLARNHRLDAKINEVAVDPIGSVAFVASQLRWVDDGNVVLIDDVHSFKQRGQRLVVMRLTRRQMHMQRMPVTIAEQMDFRGKTATGSP